MRLSRPLAMLYATGFLRSLGVGTLGVVLGVYLSRLGFIVTRIGLVLGAGLAGISISTILVSVLADHIGRRRSLVVLSVLTAFGGFISVPKPRFSQFVMRRSTSKSHHPILPAPLRNLLVL